MNKQSPKSDEKELSATIFDIQTYSINDGPGIRTTVFFKGCPLTCLWCSNPESQKKNPQLMYLDTLCTRCQRCVSVCPTGATTFDPDSMSILVDRNLCNVCGKCIDVCPAEARVISGHEVTVSELLEIVKKDTLFYGNSGGGVTASGGECTAQHKFLAEFFKRCQESYIHTTLDTCGFVKWKHLEKILKYTELVLFDIKHIDPVKHKELTGVDNGLILENLKKTVSMGKKVSIRMPLIPGCNDSDENILAVCMLLKDIAIDTIDILPYHRLGRNKYKRLDWEYKLEDTAPLEEERVEHIRKKFESFGIYAKIA